jgi:hypothetical protein
MYKNILIDLGEIKIFNLHNIISYNTLTPTSSISAFESTRHHLVDEWCWWQDQASYKTIVLQESNIMNTQWRPLLNKVHNH